MNAPGTGKPYELTGPRSRDMTDVAAYADARGRLITYVNMSFDQWRDQELGKRGLSERLFEHFLTMAHLTRLTGRVLKPDRNRL